MMNLEQLLQYPVLQKEPEVIKLQAGLRHINSAQVDELRMRMDTGAAHLDIPASAGRWDDLPDEAIAQVMRPMTPKAAPAIIGVDHLRKPVDEKNAIPAPATPIIMDDPGYKSAPGVFAPGSTVDEKDLLPHQRRHLRMAEEHARLSLGETGIAVAGQLRAHMMPRKKKKKLTRAKPKQSEYKPTSELKPAGPKEIEKMQKWAKNYLRRNPNANYDQVQLAVKKHFKIRVQI